MTVRQQVYMTEKEVTDVLVEFLKKKKGLRLNTAELRKDGSFFATTLTEEEIYKEDTLLILNKDFSLLDFKNPKLHQKITERLNLHCNIKNPKVADVLEGGIPDNESRWENFRNGVLLNKIFLTDFVDNKTKIDKKEEELLIQVFGDLGIKVKKQIEN